MTDFVTITLENEMDMMLAFKRSIRIAESIGLSKSTQTAFATAVSEVGREVVDRAFDSTLRIGITLSGSRYYLTARVSCRVDDSFGGNAAGIEYARKLVPTLDVLPDKDSLDIVMKVSVPSSARLNPLKITEINKRLKSEGPISAYEEVKIRNAELSQHSQQQELALIHAAYLNQQKNEFLSVASHELNTPLTVLRSYAQIALRDCKEDSPLTKYLTKIEHQSTKLAALISQLLDVSKIENGKLVYEMASVEASSFLTSCIDACRLLFPTHELIADIACECNISIDRLRLEQVLTNLVSNAVKYSEPGPVWITAQVNDSALSILVIDKGIGMSTTTQTKVFNKFYRNKEIAKTHNGLGIGLYITSQIVSDHGGTIQIKSAIGEGTTMSISIPTV